MAPAQGPGRAGLSRARRLASGPEIRAMFERGKRSRTAHLDVFDSPSPVALFRLGVVVPRYGRSAVARNALKRRIREIARVELMPRAATLEGSVPDVLVRARREAYQASWAELREQLLEWWDRRWSRGSSSR